MSKLSIEQIKILQKKPLSHERTAHSHADILFNRVTPMTGDEILERRAILRQVLRRTQFANRSNEQLDNARLMVSDDVIIFEDESGYQYALNMSKALSGDGDFRRMRAQIPFEYKDVTLDKVKWELYRGQGAEQRELVTTYLTKFEEFQKDGYGLYIYSGVMGSGKTMLACAIINGIANKYAASVKFINVLDLLELTKKSYDKSSPADGLKSLYDARVLVLDEFGREMRKEWIDTALYRLINYRYTEHLPTIYTSNLATEELKVDDRIRDRIESRCYVVHMPEVCVRRNLNEIDKRRFYESVRKVER